MTEKEHHQVKIGLWARHNLVRYAIERILQDNFNTVITFPYLADILLELGFQTGGLPDVILLENQSDIVKTINDIIKLFPSMKILILTEPGEVDNILDIIGAGGHGCITKDIEKNELISNILDTAREGRLYSKSFIDALIHALKKGYQKDNISRTAIINEPSAIEFRLTVREREILRLTTEGLSIKEIAMSLFLSQRTIDAHRQNIMKKVGAKNVAELVKIAVTQHLI